jgi:nuclear pore complex protein Nup205
MAEEDSLAALQGLHRDLCAHIDLQLPVLERLIHNLEAHLEDLKALLDKKPKSDASRQALGAGMHRVQTVVCGTPTDCARQDQDWRRRV